MIIGTLYWTNRVCLQHGDHIVTIDRCDFTSVVRRFVHLNCSLGWDDSYTSCRVWARGRCRISPPRFLAECCKRQLNQGSFVLLYFRLLYIFFWFVFSLSVFSCIVLFVSISQVIGCEDRLRKMTYIVSSGALNSTPTSNQPTTDLSCCSVTQLGYKQEHRLDITVEDNYIWYFVSTPVPSVNCCDGLDRCILYCILFVFMLVLLCFCVATEFSVSKDLYNDIVATAIKSRPFCAWVQHANHSATEPPRFTVCIDKS